MKRIIALILVISTITCPAFAFAEKINALSFCELYIKRLIDFEDNTGIDIQDFGIEDYSLTNSKCPDGSILTNCCAGTLTVNTDDMSVESWCNILTAPTDDSEVAMQRTVQAALAISALEYSEIDSISIRYIEGMTPMEKAFVEILQPVMSDTSVYVRIRETGKQEKIYSGNYSYYLDYFENGDDAMIMILAE